MKNRYSAILIDGQKESLRLQGDDAFKLFLELLEQIEKCPSAKGQVINTLLGEVIHRFDKSTFQ